MAQSQRRKNQHASGCPHDTSRSVAVVPSSQTAVRDERLRGACRLVGVQQRPSALSPRRPLDGSGAMSGCGRPRVVRRAGARALQRPLRYGRHVHGRRQFQPRFCLPRPIRLRPLAASLRLPCAPVECKQMGRRRISRFSPFHAKNQPLPEIVDSFANGAEDLSYSGLFDYAGPSLLKAGAVCRPKKCAMHAVPQLSHIRAL